MIAIADDIWAILRELAQSQKDTERMIKEQSRETDRKIKEVTQAIGRLGNRLGDFIEDAVHPRR